MRSWSFPMVRVMGVEVRIHMSFVLLLILGLVYANQSSISLSRAFALWILLLGAVVVREIARSIIAAYYGLELRNVLLLPVGGLFSFLTAESSKRATDRRTLVRMAMIGPLTSLIFGLALGATMISASPAINLLASPWITPLHLLRSAMWLNIFLAFVNFLPAYPLDMGRIIRAAIGRGRPAPEATRAASTLASGVTLLLAITGLITLFLWQSPWLLVASVFIFVGGQLEDQGVLFQSVVDTVHMRDVMLTDFSTLSPGDTLEYALLHSVHSLQDDFPVVRGQDLVGVVSRQNIIEALRSEGNGYVQGIMSKAFQVAQPEDSLAATFRRITQGRGLSLVPVLEGERIVGIVTLQNLMHSMGLLAERRRITQQE